VIRTVLRALPCALVVAAVAVPTANAGIGPDYVSSDNLELVTRIKTPGDGVGAKIVGKYMYVTSTTGLLIYDIEADPENPPLVGTEAFNLEFENEEVPTNGKILGISADTFCVPVDPVGIGNSAAGTDNCLSIYDVSNPAAPQLLTVVNGAGDHTSACVLDCQYFMGSYGSVTDARDPAHAKLIGKWTEDFEFQSGCHHVREVQPGILLGSCQPIILMSVRPEDGGSVLKPKLLATGTNSDDRFIHSSRWPNAGTDKFMVAGGETNFSPTCDDTVGAFMVWDATDVLKNGGSFVPGAPANFTVGSKFKLLSEVRPTSGVYADGHSPYNALGCSVHWFEEQPAFKNGGVLALAEYENGTRLLQITPEGKIVEQGYFLPLGGSTSAPHWNPNGKDIYAIDYERGIDVLRYTGPTYVPNNAGVVVPEPGTTPGTNKSLSGGPECATTAGFASASAKAKGHGVSFKSTLRKASRYDVRVVRRSTGRKLANRTVARFKSKRGAFTWTARGQRDGTYVALFTTKPSSGRRDIRKLVLRRSHGRFARVSAYSLDRPCGVFAAYSLSGPVFGGKGSKPLGISYKLAEAADGVTVQVRVATRLVKSFSSSGEAGKPFKFTLPASSVPRGKDVQVGVTVRRGGDVATRTLTARRL
jgi:hypothetical protein